MRRNKTILIYVLIVIAWMPLIILTTRSTILEPLPKVVDPGAKPSGKIEVKEYIEVMKKYTPVPTEDPTSYILHTTNREPPSALNIKCNLFSEEDYKNGTYSCMPTDEETILIDEQTKIMAYFIKKSMKFYWDNYVKCAFGFDELMPLTCSGRNNWGGIGMTIIDNLDTLYLMDLKLEYQKAESYIKNNLNISNLDYFIPFHIISTHILGSYLSMYGLSSDDYYKRTAIELANKLLHQFETSTFPPDEINLKQDTHRNYDRVILPLVTTFGLEFRYLSQITSDPIYDRKGLGVYMLMTQHTANGLLPEWVYHRRLRGKVYFYSFYTTTVKMYIVGGEKEYDIHAMLGRSKNAIKKRLISNSNRNKFHYLGELRDYYAYWHDVVENNSRFDVKTSCGAAGYYALLASTAENPTAYDDRLRIAKALVYTCYRLYIDNKITKLSPDSLQFNIIEPNVMETFPPTTVAPQDPNQQQDSNQQQQQDPNQQQQQDPNQQQQQQDPNLQQNPNQQQDTQPPTTSSPQQDQNQQDTQPPTTSSPQQDQNQNQQQNQQQETPTPTTEEPTTMFDMKGEDTVVLEKSHSLQDSTIESLFILHQLTRDPIFQKWGWEIYLAIENNAKVPFGYSEMSDVNDPKSHNNRVRPTFGSKVMKYLYLLLSNHHRIDFRNYVFNDQGHPFEL